MEKEAQIKDAEKDIRGWMIEVLTENEDGMDIIKEIAREKLGMVEATVMPANIVASLFKLTNMLPTAFRKLTSAVETFWGRRMFASAEKSVSQLRIDAVLPITDHWMNGEDRINYRFDTRGFRPARTTRK
jgi:hypothetical protein